MRENLKNARKAAGLTQRQLAEQTGENCIHEFLPADMISPFAIWCIKCGRTLIKNPYDGNIQECYLPSGYPR